MARLKDAPAEMVTIGNLQKIGEYRFYGASTKATEFTPWSMGQMYKIPAGGDGEIPATVWDRYKDRADVQSHLGDKIVFGGVANATMAELSGAHAQRSLLVAQERKIAEEREQLEALRAELTRRETALRETQN